MSYFVVGEFEVLAICESKQEAKEKIDQLYKGGYFGELKIQEGV